MLGSRSRGAACVVAVAIAAVGARAQPDGLVGPRPDEQGLVGWSIADAVNAQQNSAGDEGRMPLGTPRASALRPLDDQSSGPADDAERDAPLGGADSDASTMTTSAIRTIGALTLVIVLILALGWAYKRVFGARAFGRFGARAPSGLVEVLARYPLPPRHSLVVLRFGQRVLLVSHGAKGGDLTTLCELEDPGEVAGVLEIAREMDGRSINARFREAISEADEHFESAMLRTPEGYEPPPTHAAHTEPEPDRATLLHDDRADVSPLRRRLDSMREGVYA